MQANNLLRKPFSRLSTMSDHSSPIHSPSRHLSENKKPHVDNHSKNGSITENNGVSNNGSVSGNILVVRSERPSRSCRQKAAERLRVAAAAEAEVETKRKKGRRRERLAARLLKEESDEEKEGSSEEEEGGNEENGEMDSKSRSSRIITPLVGEPEPSQLQRWNIRSMWQLASVLNFLNVFRPLLNIKVEFSAEELETALITPNSILADLHMPILKAIPPVARMALGHSTWITVLCRKLRHWWYWVAEGDLPIVASQGAEVEAYNALDPAVRVVILKALCDIRVEQEDIRNYIDYSIKHGVQLSLFRKERIGGDSHGISYWYEDDPIIGHRLYREIRKFEVKKGKGRNVPPIPDSSYQWEAVATNLDEFQNVFEKLISSTNRTEVSVGRKLKNDMLPEIEKVHKRKEKLLKKQHREALMLDSMMDMDGLAAGRSRRGRKPVTYTFDDYDRSINEAFKVTKNNQPSPQHFERRDPLVEHEVSTNGRWGEHSQYSEHVSFSALSPNLSDDDEYDDQKIGTLDRGNRRRRRPQRYSANCFVEALSDSEADFNSDCDIVGEVVYDDEYLRKRKQRGKMSSSSEGEGDEEYNWDEENPEEEEEEEEEEEGKDSLSTSEDSDTPRKIKSLPGRTRRASRVRSVDEYSGLRRSKRATRNRIDYTKYEMSESETESKRAEKSNGVDDRYNASDNEEFLMDSEDSENIDDKQEMHIYNKANVENSGMVDEKQVDYLKRADSEDREVDDVKTTRFLDLNELAPGSGFDDGPI